MTQLKCLNEETLTSYLEGLLDPPVRAAAEQHLVGCDECRSQLVFYMRILDDEVGDEEDSVVQSAMAQWERRPMVAAGRPGGFYARWAALAASLIVALSLGAVVAFGPHAEPEPAEIVQLLLSVERPFEARLSEQPYRPLFETRGETGPDIATDPLETELLRQAASDHLMGTFYLLNEDFERAIRYLEGAAGKIADDPSVHNDLGVAYLEKIEDSEERQAFNLSRARQQFERAVGLDAAYAPAVFNLTLLFARQNLWAEVSAHRDRYLALDSDSRWADEIKKLGNLN